MSYTDYEMKVVELEEELSMNTQELLALRNTIEELRYENDKLKKTVVAAWTCNIAGLNNEKYNRLVDTLKFYADKDNWWWHSEFPKEYMDNICDSDMEVIGHEYAGGLRARQTLKELGIEG